MKAKNIVTLVLILVFLIFGCNKDHNSNNTINNDSIEHKSFKLAIFHLYVSSMIISTYKSTSFDKDLDCFKNEKISPEIIKRSKGPEIVDALIGDSADFGTLAVTPIVFQILKGNLSPFPITFLSPVPK